MHVIAGDEQYLGGGAESTLHRAIIDKTHRLIYRQWHGARSAATTELSTPPDKLQEYLFITDRADGVNTQLNEAGPNHALQPDDVDKVGNQAFALVGMGYSG